MTPKCTLNVLPKSPFVYLTCYPNIWLIVHTSSDGASPLPPRDAGSLSRWQTPPRSPRRARLRCAPAFRAPNRKPQQSL
jgi:hypothetical protein